MKRKRMILISSIISILFISLIVYTILDTRYWGVGYVEGAGGMCYVSEIYDAGDNTSYVVDFHDITFTFMYWTYPYGWADYHYTVYFLIEFPDNTTEIITLTTGSGWYTFGFLTRPFFTVTADHSNPIAGVLSGDYLDRYIGWQFVVSIE